MGCAAEMSDDIRDSVGMTQVLIVTGGSRGIGAAPASPTHSST